jgi:hypothetical protein
MVTQVAEGTAVTQLPDVRPYRPGWLDAIVAGIERLPGPIWLAYAALSALALALVALEAALSSRGLSGQDPAYFVYAIYQVFGLAAYHFLSRGALSAWEGFLPATQMDDATAARWRLELSTTPARPAAMLWLLGAAGYIAMLAWSPAGFDLTGHQPAFVVLRVILEAFWIIPVTYLAVYLVFRQTRLVSRLHREIARVDLLQPAPLHAMARLTARASIVLLVFLSTAALPLPNVSAEARLAILATALPFVAIALAAFVLPLRGIQARLEAEKARRLGEVAARIDATVATLHSVVDTETSGQPDAEASRLAQTRIDALNKALASLLQERDFVRRLPTWPWDTGTLRAVLSAVALPVVLFLATRALERFVL